MKTQMIHLDAKLPHILTLVFLSLTMTLSAQSELDYVPGEGIKFKMNQGDYTFGIGGMIQPEIAYETFDGGDPQYYFGSRRTFLRLNGLSVPDGLSFLIQADLSDQDILLDAWFAYEPTDGLEFKIGQMQSIGNNREMLFMEDHLSFIERSLLSTSLSRTGREFGLAVSYGNSFGQFFWKAQAMFSSGDGRNSFGADSRDVDLGGYKYAARLDLMPFGEFAKGNGDQLVDLVGEEKPKILLGFAGSLNNGASEAVGEGHGGIELYDVDGSVQYANYRKVYTDLLLKYKGFALLGEYGITTAAGLDGLYTDPFGESVLQPAEISGYYALSSAWNANLSYTYKGMWGLDLRMSNVQPEFDLSSSLIRPQESMLIGVTRYFSGQNIKVQVAAGQQDFDGASTTVGNLICQVRF